MTIFSRFRFYHAAMGILAITAYVTEELTALHLWIGYSLAFLVGARILMAAIAPRFLTAPHWLFWFRDLSLSKGLSSPIIGKGMLVTIMASMLIVIASGIFMDQSGSSNKKSGMVISTALPDYKRADRNRLRPNKIVKATHEVAANVMFMFVFLHIIYLLILRRQYALSMIFVRVSGH